jgi:hypothetical protein
MGEVNYVERIEDALKLAVEARNAAGVSEQGRQLSILVTQIELLLAYAEKVSK